MATSITHVFAAAALGKAVFPEKMPARFWVLAAGCALLPDLDVIGFRLGIRYADTFGHRGFSHSLLFGLLVALLVTLAAFRKERLFSQRWWGLVVFFFSIMVSHGMLDAMTNGGYGVAFFAPFDRTRYFFPWQPLRVSPIGIHGFLGKRGLSVIVSELIYVWLPLVAAAGGLCFLRRKNAAPSHAEEQCSPRPE